MLTDGGVRFVANDATRAELQRNLIQMTESRKWPLATHGISGTINFTVQGNVVKDGPQIDLFRLSYLDYDGRLLDGVHGTNDPTHDDGHPVHGAGETELAKYIRNADVLLGILDGERIYAMMHGNEDQSYRTWLDQLTHLILAERNKTAHLVLTKFDLFAKQTDHPENELSNIRATLEKLQPFRQFRRAERPGRVRLIPVAAVGRSGFAQPQD